MRLSKARIVAAKDLKTFRRKRSILYSIVLFPLIVSIGLPLVVFQIVGSRSGGIPPSFLGPLMDSFAFFFIIGAATLPTSIASYSILGEKVEKSLEPLLATPTTDGEILLGKSLASLIPPIGATFSLHEAAAALRYVADGRAIGKVVLEIRGSRYRTVSV